MKPIRKQYEIHGVDAYYSKEADNYSNPHFEQIKSLLIQNESRIDFRQILDLSCGHGEVCQVLRELGYTGFSGSDPYTWESFEKKLETPCYKWSFEDVIKGKMKGEYSSIICSFAMHLCPEKQLYPLAFQLFQHTKQLVIITPHKRPVLEKLDGVQLDFEDFSLTVKGKKVRLKSYSYSL